MDVFVERHPDPGMCSMIGEGSRAFVTGFFAIKKAQNDE